MENQLTKKGTRDGRLHESSISILNVVTLITTNGYLGDYLYSWEMYSEVFRGKGV